MKAEVAIREDREYQARALVDLAKLFFSDPKNQAAFEAWQREKGVKPCKSNNRMQNI